MSLAVNTGFHNDGAKGLLQSYFQGKTAPATDDFAIRLGNSLLLMIDRSAGTSFTGDNTITGDTSGDIGNVEGIETLNEGGSSNFEYVRCSGISEVEVFELGEGVTGDVDGNGTICNACFNLSSVSNARFLPNEQISGGTSGHTADIKGVFGDIIEVNNMSGNFQDGETITGAESNAQASVDKRYAGVPGFLDADTTSELTGEPAGGDLSGSYPRTLSPGTSDFPTVSTDLNGNDYIETKQVTFTASGATIGPINTIILTATGGDPDQERIVGSAPLQGCPPSETIADGSSLNTKYAHTLD